MAFLTGLFRFVYRARYRALAGLPGPPPSFPFGNALRFKGRRPWEVCAELQSEYGGVCLVWLMGTPVVVVNDAEAVERILESRRSDYYKDGPCPALRPVLTMSSPNINNGEEWRRKRAASALTQPWAGAWIAAQLGPVTAHLGREAAALAARSATRPEPMLPLMQRWICDLFSIMAIGRPLEDERYRDFLELATRGSVRMLSNKPFGPELDEAGVSARGRWQGLFRAAIERAQRDGSRAPERSDLVGFTRAHGTSLSMDDEAAELGNLFFGGGFSVSSTIVHALWQFTHNPEAARRLTAALDDLGDVDCAKDFARVDGCVALDRFVRESFRVHPAVPLFTRRVQEDGATELGGVTLPGNTMVFLTSWFLHKDPAHWHGPGRSSPEAFDPERWDAACIAANPLGSGHFFPMGGGPRMCLGWELALATIKMTLFSLLRDWDVEVGLGQPYDAGEELFFGVRMPNGLLARVRPRGPLRRVAATQ
ncbi:MAG: cytochrome P450 [Planctomycetota bacterium]